MFNSIILDVAIGLAFVYLLLGLMCTTINEWIAGLLKRRAKNLEDGLRRLLNAPPDGTYAIRSADLKDAAALATKLKSGTDALSAWIRAHFDPQNAQIIQSYSGGDITPPLVEAVLAELNKQIASPDLFDKQRFPHSRLSAEEIQKARRDPKKIQELNRNLLHEGYADEIAGLSDEFYRHPLIKALTQKSGHPSYVPSRTFALALMDIILKDQQGPTDYNALLEGIRKLPDSDVRRALLAILQNSDATLNAAQTQIETWFDDAMDRVSGWYKRETQVITVIVAAAITIFANADTLHIGNQLYRNSVLREALVQHAKEQPAKQEGLLGQLVSWSDEFSRFNKAACPSCAPDDTFPGRRLLFYPAVLWSWLCWLIPQHIGGWALTAVAVSLGAPFWFDTLNRFMNLRAAGKSPEEPPKNKPKVS